MCFSQNGRSPIGRHVATSEAASSFTLSDTNPLSHHRSRPHEATNAVPLNQAQTHPARSHWRAFAPRIMRFARTNPTRCIGHAG